MNLLLRVIFALLAVSLSGSLAAKPPTVKSLKKERTSTTRQIKETDRQLKDTKRETTTQLRRLDQLRSDIENSKSSIAAARAGVDSLIHSISGVNNSISEQEAKIRRLQDSYVKALRQMQRTTSNASILSFILSSESFAQAGRRVSYLREFAAWRRRKAAELADAHKELNRRKETLQALHGRKASALNSLSRQNRQLESQQQEASQVVAQLRQKQGELSKRLAEQQQRLRRLDSQIDNLIAQEMERRRAAEKQRREKAEKARAEKRAKQAKASKNKQTQAKPSKPEPPQPQTADPDRALTGSFEQNKGRLLFPVAGRYTIARKFGRQPHPELPHVTTDNSGIDITVPTGTSARAIFGGKVSAIFSQDGFNSIVMVRHGAYISIYAGLTGLTVRNGQEVTAGQTLGTVAPDSNLHFELRHERTKLNPLNWVR